MTIETQCESVNAASKAGTSYCKRESDAFADRFVRHQPITGIYKSIHTHYNTRSNPWETETNRSSIDVCQNSSDESKTVDQPPSIDSLPIP